MNLHQLELFCAVVERRGFARAGAQLFITPSALSIQVKRLERDLGLTLLRRVPGGMVPTDAGRELYTLGRSLLELRKTAARRMADLRQGTVGTISLATFNTAPLYYLAETLRAFRAIYPRVTTTVQVGDREELLDAMLRGTLDLGLDWAPITRAGIAVEPLLRSPFVVIAAPDHPLASLPVVEREHFEATPYIGLQLGPRAPGFVEAALERAGLRPNVVMRLQSTDDVRRLVEAGLGIFTTARISVEREIAAGRLVGLNLAGFSFTQQLVLFRPADQPRSPAVDNFCAFLRDHLRQQAEGPV